MCERYECKLSPELLEKARKELNEPETNEIRLAAIDKLRTRFNEEAKDFELVRSDDGFLLRFLRVRKFDCDRAYDTLVNYHTHRKEWRDLYDMVDNPKSVEHLLSRGPIMPLRGRARDGTFVVLGRPGLGFKDGDTFLHFLAAIVLTMEKLLEDEEVQIRGVTVIEDMANFGLTMAMQMTSLGRKFLHLMQDSMPVRVKSLNMVNEALVFDAVYAIVSRFMKDKLKNRLTLHGSVYKTLHEKIEPSVLPSFLGGTGPDLAVEYWKEQLLSTEGEGEETSL